MGPLSGQRNRVCHDSSRFGLAGLALLGRAPLSSTPLGSSGLARFGDGSGSARLGPVKQQLFVFLAGGLFFYCKFCGFNNRGGTKTQRPTNSGLGPGQAWLGSAITGLGSAGLGCPCGAVRLSVLTLHWLRELSVSDGWRWLAASCWQPSADSCRRLSAAGRPAGGQKGREGECVPNFIFGFSPPNFSCSGNIYNDYVPNKTNYLGKTPK